MKVIGAGFGRTGTTSLRAALEELGFGPCYHMTELLDKPAHVETWQAAARGETVDWEGLFGGYAATVDWPGCAFYKELAEAYPDAKVLLSIRDPEEWYESVANTIYGVPKTVYASPVLSLMRRFVPTVRHAARITDEVIWDGTFDGRFEDRRYAVKVYERHIEEVRRRIPDDRLLVYEMGSGWEPLCEFLGVEAPGGKPFPRLNDTEAFRRKVRRRFALPVAVPVVGLALAVSALLLHRLAR